MPTPLCKNHWWPVAPSWLVLGTRDLAFGEISPEAPDRANARRKVRVFGFAKASDFSVFFSQQTGREVALVVVFDNCAAAANVRDETLHNRSDFLAYTVVYALEPAVPRPMFPREAVDYGAVAVRA